MQLRTVPVGRRLARLATPARVWWTGWFKPRLIIVGGVGGEGGCSIDDISAAMGKNQRYWLY